MHMLHVRDLLAQVFVGKGYHVEEGPLGGLLARSPGETLLVEWKADAAATGADVRALASALAGSGATRAILVAAGGVAPGAVHEGTQRGVETWSLSRAALEVGLAALEAADDGPPAGPVAAPAPVAERPPIPGAPAYTAPPSQGPPSAATSPSMSLVARAASLASGDSGGAMLLPSKAREVRPTEGTRVLPSPWDIASGAARVPAQDIEAKARSRGRVLVAKESDADVELVGGAKVKPARPAAPALPPNAALRARIDESGAASAVPELGRIQTMRMTLVPHVAFDFDCHVEHSALPVPITARGTVLAHGVTGTLREVPILEFAAAPDAAERVPAKLGAIDVLDRVKGHILRQTTKDVKVEKEVGGVTVTGTERIGPGAEGMGLAHRGVVHVPVWRIVGEHGTAEVDATNGEVLAKSLTDAAIL